MQNAGVVRIPQLLQYVLSNPKTFPGPHQKSAPRTSADVGSVDNRRQLQMIWDATTARLEELFINEGSSVNWPGVGVFSYVRTIKSAKNNVGNDVIGPALVAREPAFVPDNGLKDACPKTSEKSSLDLQADALTAAQSLPNRVHFLNLISVASGIHLDIHVVNSAMKAIGNAIKSLVKTYQLELDLVPNKIKLIIKNKAISCKFSKEFKSSIPLVSVGNLNSSGHGAKEASGPSVNVDLPRISETWKKASYSKAMANFLPPTDGDAFRRTSAAVHTLRICSQDMSTCK